MVWNIFSFPIQLGISSSQLTKSIIFQRGRAKNHQPAVNGMNPTEIRSLGGSTATEAMVNFTFLSSGPLHNVHQCASMCQRCFRSILMEFIMVLQLPYDGYTSDSEITLNCYGKPHHNRNFSCPSGGLKDSELKWHGFPLDLPWFTTPFLLKTYEKSLSAVIPSDPPRPLLSRVTATRRWKRAHI